MKQIGKEERVKIYGYLQQWLNKYEIGIRLWRHHSTIWREITRNSKWWEYNPLEAENRCKERKVKENKSRGKLVRDKGMRKYIMEKLESEEEDWSPDGIVGRMKQEGKEIVCTKTIYNYIHEYEPSKVKRLRHKWWYRRKRWLSSGYMNDTIESIDMRDKRVEVREDEWDWEWDTMVSKNRSCGLLTYVERKTRYVVIGRIENWKSEHIHEETMRILKMYKWRIRSMTIDNGKEFGEAEVTWVYLGVKYYRAHPYSSWERWTNEHTNWMIRKRLPKKYDFKDIKREEIERLQNKMNKKVRKIHWYATPYELFHNIKLALCS